MGDLDLAVILPVLHSANPDKPWMTAQRIASRLQDRWPAKAIEQVLLAHYETCAAQQTAPLARYSSLPSRQSLNVLWGATTFVGTRTLEGITKNALADESLGTIADTAASDVFLSHSFRDYEPVTAIARSLLDAGLLPWLAETHIGADEHIHEAVIRGLDQSQALLLFLSPHALNSRWTGKEFQQACCHDKTIFLVADLDAPLICALLQLMQTGSQPPPELLADCSHGTRDFIEQVCSNSAAVAKVFWYARNAELSPAQARLAQRLEPLSALAGAIRASQPE